MTAHDRAQPDRCRARHRARFHRFAEPAGGDYARVDMARFGEPLMAPGTDAPIVLG
jgi:hypothetical protein